MHRYKHYANEMYELYNGNEHKLEYWVSQAYRSWYYTFEDVKKKHDEEQQFVENFAKEMSEKYRNFTYYNPESQCNDDVNRYFKLVHPYNKHDRPLFWMNGYLEYIEDIQAMEGYKPEDLTQCLKSLDDSKGKYRYTIRNIVDYSKYHSWFLPCLTVTGSFSLLEQANVARAMLQSKSYIELLKWFKENKGKAFYNGFGSHVLLGGFELNGMRTKPNGMGWYTCGVRDQLQNYFKDMLQLEYGVGILRVMDGYGHNNFDGMVSEIVGKAIEEYDIKLTNTQLEAQKLNGEDIHPIDQMFPEGLPQTPTISTGSLLLFITLMIFFSLFNIRVYLWVFTIIFFILGWFFNNR